jgi:hypothetical protein
MSSRWLAVKRVLSACLLCCGSLFAGLGGGFPVTVAARQADIIAVARLESVAAATPALANVQLQTTRVVKGDSVPAHLSAEFTSSPNMVASSFQPPAFRAGHLIGKAGLWFLKRDGGKYVVVPLGTGDYVFDQAFLILPTSELPDPATVLTSLPASSGSAGEIVMAALVNSYLSSTNPNVHLRDLVFVSLVPNMARFDSAEDRPLATAAAKALIGSKLPDRKIVGLVSGIRRGDESVFSSLAQEAAALESERLFPLIAFALGTEYRPNGKASIEPLRRLIGLHLKNGNFDAAVAGALSKIGTKAVLPAMVSLLDSEDSGAVLVVARFLSDYTLFANASGVVPVLGPGEGRIRGPWATPATRAFSPGAQPSLTPQDYASFWKAWWADNGVKLGFTD